ncbi:MAG: hypothetical protein ACC682_04400 [Gemmatimonadota bacterium]
MRTTRQSTLVHGVLGGLLAGVVVATWFLAADLFAGDPFRTPARLGAALFGHPELSTGVLVSFYSVVHLGTFAIVGGLTGLLLGATGAAPGIFLGAFLGVCVLTAIHYVGMLITGQPLLDVLPPVHVVGANIVAGMVFMAYMHRAEREERPLGIATLQHHPIIAEGLKIGLVGAGAVAAWFFLIDVLAGTPFLTPGALGSAVFLGADDPGAVSMAPGLIMSYSVLHLVVFSAVGVFFVAVAHGIEHFPSFAYLTTMCAILLEAISFAVLVSVGQAVLGSISLWSIGVANIIAIGSMAGLIWKTHPKLRENVLAQGFASLP